MLLFLVVEDVFKVPGVVVLRIYGVVSLGFLSVVSLGISGKVLLWVPDDFSIGITDIAASLFTGVFSLGLPYVIPVKFSFKILVDPCSL